MGFDTSKHKIQKLWEKSQDNTNLIDSVKIIQNKKETSIKLSESNNTQINTPHSLNSEWIPISIIYPSEVFDVNTYQGGGFKVELVLPEANIPFARLYLAFRRTDGEVFDYTHQNFDYTQFSQIFKTDNDNIKKVVWFVYLFQGTTPNLNNIDNYVLRDFEIKLFFTLLNPLYSTAS